MVAVTRFMIATTLDILKVVASLAAAPGPSLGPPARPSVPAGAPAVAPPAPSPAGESEGVAVSAANDIPTMAKKTSAIMMN